MSNLCQGFSYFSGFLHHFILVKVATTSIRFKIVAVKRVHLTQTNIFKLGFESVQLDKPILFRDISDPIFSE